MRLHSLVVFDSQLLCAETVLDSVTHARNCTTLHSMLDICLSVLFLFSSRVTFHVRVLPVRPAHGIGICCEHFAACRLGVSGREASFGAQISKTGRVPNPHAQNLQTWTWQPTDQNFQILIQWLIENVSSGLG